MKKETGVYLTEVLLTRLVYWIQRIFRSDHVSKASSRLARAFCDCPVHASELYTNTKRTILPLCQLPDVLLVQRHTVPGNTDAPKDLGFTTSCHCKLHTLPSI